MTDHDVVIIGAGVTGVALARALALRGRTRIAVVEKETAVAMHTSGHNSGVVHVGYNQKPGTLKAKLVVEGNRMLRELCQARSVPLVAGGILIVARDVSEVPRLEELLRRGTENGVIGLRLLDGQDIESVEPNARGAGALHAPTGASVDSRALVMALADEARQLGVELRTGLEVETVERTASGFELRAAGERLRCAHLVNCAGLHADRIAHRLGAGRGLSIVPVRGEYRLVVPERADIVRSMVYPVPDLAFPFLGVHWTRSAHGEVLVGPNAVPALGREAYRWRDVTIRDALAQARDRSAWKLMMQPGFVSLIANQIATSVSLKRFAADARALVPSIRAADLRPGPAGIRAQLVDASGKMVEDLLIEENDGALHVLNVVSPGFTCSLAFAEMLADRLS